MTPYRQRIQSSLDAVVRRRLDITVAGPCLADETGEEGLLEAFKTAYVSRFAPYLLNRCHRDLDAALLRQGRHTCFYAKSTTGIVAYVRLRGRPFEWEWLLPDLARYATRHARSVEFSRLMVEPSVRGIEAGKILMGTATLWAMDQGYSGIIALCRPSTRKLFQRYGLSACACGAVRIEARNNGEYFLMAGRWSEVAGCQTIRRRESDELHHPGAADLGMLP